MNQSLTTALRLATGALLLCCAHVASAQYMWVDAKGVKQFSDRPPPPEVPLKNILRAPKGQPSAATEVAVVAAGGPVPAEPSHVAAVASAASPATNKPLSLAERNADFLKRRQEQEKKEREEKSQRVAAAAGCTQARGARSALDAARRIVTADKNGEPSYMSDEQRSAEGKRLDAELAACGKS